jgi:dolichol kinase
MPSTAVPVISFRAELLRKGLHALALVLPFGVLAFEEQLRLPLIGLALIALLGDVLRSRYAAPRRFLHKWFGTLMRPEEMPPLGGPLVINGATWMCVAAALCASVFPPAVAAAALAIQMLGDGAAAIVGRRWGKVKLFGTGKTLEGALAFFAVGLAIALVAAQWPDASLTIRMCFAGAFAGALAELLPLGVNDNFRVPIVAGLAMILVA